jgi:hypothetical protein
MFSWIWKEFTASFDCVYVSVRPANTYPNDSTQHRTRDIQILKSSLSLFYPDINSFSRSLQKQFSSYSLSLTTNYGKFQQLNNKKTALLILILHFIVNTNASAFFVYSFTNPFFKNNSLNGLLFPSPSNQSVFGIAASSAQSVTRESDVWLVTAGKSQYSMFDGTQAAIRQGRYVSEWQQSVVTGCSDH